MKLSTSALTLAMACAALPAIAQEPLRFPPEIRSENGVLNTTLQAVIDTNYLGEKRIITRTFNGIIPGPTIRVKPGDTMNILLENMMPPNSMPHSGNLNRPHNINSTNIHTHGLFVSPEGRSDNPFISVEPGQSFQYQIIIPEEQAPGTNWYHPHRHGSIWAQMASGMSGLLIIEGDYDEVPEIAAAREIPLVFQGIATNNDGIFPDPNPDATTIGQIFPGTLQNTVLTVNGQPGASLTAKSGEVLLFRMVNAHGYSNLPVKIVNQLGQIIPIYHISTDGNAFAQPVETDSVMLYPGNRADILVRVPAVIPEITVADTIRMMVGASTMLTIDYLEITTPTDIPSTLPVPGIHKTIQPEEITESRDVVFSMKMGEEMNNGFLIDGKPFDPDRVDQLLTLDKPVEWRITNESDRDHPFHIHINDFMVVAVNDIPVQTPRWQDVVNLPPLGSATIRMRPEKFTGKTVMHCHIIIHEDMGMMAVVEINAPDVSAEDEKLPTATAMRAWPNPVTGNKVTAQGVLPNMPATAEWYSYDGRLLMSQTVLASSDGSALLDKPAVQNSAVVLRLSSGTNTWSQAMMIR